MDDDAVKRAGRAAMARAGDDVPSEEEEDVTEVIGRVDAFFIRAGSSPDSSSDSSETTTAPVDREPGAREERGGKHCARRPGRAGAVVHVDWSSLPDSAVALILRHALSAGPAGGPTDGENGGRGEGALSTERGNNGACCFGGDDGYNSIAHGGGSVVYREVVQGSTASCWSVGVGRCRLTLARKHLVSNFDCEKDITLAFQLEPCF